MPPGRYLALPLADTRFESYGVTTSPGQQAMPQRYQDTVGMDTLKYACRGINRNINFLIPVSPINV